jgi:hypothetical protein
MRKLLLMAVLVLPGCNRPTTTEAAASSGFGSNDPIVATAPPLPVGRYTIIHSPQVENDTMLLDTSTGHTWRLENSIEQKELVWVKITGQGD